MAGERGYRTIKLELSRKTTASVYTGPKTAGALKTMIAKSSLYDGVKLAQILEAVYVQGKKDGAREAFEQLDASVTAAKRVIPHQKPGRPRKK
jgi:hypothetical protein